MSDSKNTAATGNDRKLGFGMLAAMIVGSTIGSGIFTTTADMATAGAHSGAVLVGWAICGIGMIGLVMSFFGLNNLRPDLTNGVYSYAREGFGEFVGFNSAWGYWISALLCNVSYTTLLFGALGYFFPVFGSGNNLTSIICASVVIWAVNFLVLRGVKEAAAMNIITTISKLIPLLIFVLAIILVGAFDWETFTTNFWGQEGANPMPVGDQIKACTSGTVWSFIGIEGAVVLSGRAKKSSDVGKASMTGFIGLFIIYVLVAVLSLGTVTPEQMAEMHSPQLAQILEVAVGPWGATLINLGVILSLAGALLGWTIIAADCPFSAAQQGVFMKAFAKENKNESPAVSLFITNGIVQLFLIIIFFNESTYQAFYGLSTLMIMLPYLFSGAFYAKVAFKKEGALQNASAGTVAKARFFGVLGTIYGFWMLYSSGLSMLLVTTVLYAPGIIVYVLGKKEKGLKPFKPYEAAIAVGIVALAVVSIVMIAQGKINPF